MNIENLINEFKPKAIFLKGSKMLGLDSWDSDFDIEIMVDDASLYDTKVRRGNLDIFFIDENFNNNLKQFKEISLLQHLFIRPEDILYKRDDFNYDDFLNKIKSQKTTLLLDFANAVKSRLLNWGYHERSAKVYYHIAILSHLINDIYSLNDEEKQIIKRIKKFEIIESDKDYLKTHILNYYHFYNKAVINEEYTDINEVREWNLKQQ